METPTDHEKLKGDPATLRPTPKESLTEPIFDPVRQPTIFGGPRFGKTAALIKAVERANKESNTHVFILKP